MTSLTTLLCRHWFILAIKASSNLFYIYTSGTTGLPKAAKFSHGRFLAASSFAILNRLSKNERWYMPLPLYHSTGGVVSLSCTISIGCTLVLKRKFSASNFFKDCTELNITFIHYIGELCRYLINLPPGPYDRGHQIKKAFGNGMRPDVWVSMRDLFLI